eukprot:3399323-Amphidinium_carterae.2
MNLLKGGRHAMLPFLCALNGSGEAKRGCVKVLLQRVELACPAQERPVRRPCWNNSGSCLETDLNELCRMIQPKTSLT